jgi:hypothetical protein
MAKDPKSPETTSAAYDSMAPAWAKIQTVLDGTEAMRAAEKTYLPQHFGESDKTYKERLDRCTLLNIAKLTLNSWVGRPFSKPIMFSDVPSAIEALFPNIDLIGNDIQVFGRDWFSDGLAKSYSHCYIDFPRTDRDGIRTLADDRAEGVRPHWIHYRPEDIFFAEAEMTDGKEVLREIRIMEEVSERVGFAEVFQPQIRRVYMDPDLGGVIELYRLKEPEKKKDKREWILHESWTFSLPVIPLVTFYANREAFMVGQPPLEDLVDLNIAHWQSTSDQRAVLTVARFPILSCSGGTAEGKEIIVGPRRILFSPDPNAKFSYVEHTGKAIESGAKDLASLESNMAEYGAEFLKRRPGSVTATQRTLDTAEATSPLQDTAIRFGHALTQALDLTAQWLKLETGGTAEVHTDFAFGGGDQAELGTLLNTRKARDMSREAYLKELQRRGLLADGYDIEADALLIEQESLALNPVDLTDEEDGEETGAMDETEADVENED